MALRCGAGEGLGYGADRRKAGLDAAGPARGAGRSRPGGQLLRALAFSSARRRDVQKKAFTPPSRIGRTSPGGVGSGRRIKRRSIPARLVFIDETWAKTNMTRPMADAPEASGWSPKRRSADGGPSPSWRRCAATGSTAPCVIDGPINGRQLPGLCRQILVPTLRPGDVVVMDNLGSHKGQASDRPSAPPGQALLPARLLPGPQPNRTGLRQDQDLLRKADARTIETLGAASAPPRCFTQPNAPTTSPTPDTLQPNEIAL